MLHKRLSLEETKSLVNRLFQLNSKTANRYDYRVLLSQILPYNSFNGQGFLPGELYYRVIPSSDLPESISQLSYNPKVNFSNRGALENEPIFYCSNDIKTALFEKDLKLGEKYIVGEWTNVERFNIIPIGFESGEIIGLDNMIQISEGEREFDYISKKLVDEQDKFVQGTIIKIFMLERNDVNIKLINYTAEYVYQSNGVADAFAYPPLKRNAKGINYSMRTPLIDNEIIVCSNAIQIEIIGIEDAIIYRILNFTSVSDGAKSLGWSPTFPQINHSTNEDIYFSIDDNGDTHAYDGKNRLLF